MKDTTPVSLPVPQRAENRLLSGLCAALGVLLLVFAMGAALTWRKWPDLITDFGLQLYIPWRLSQGAVLYRDLFYMAGGPLSQYWHALLFRMFGTSFLVLIVSNFAITLLMLCVLCQQITRAMGVACGFVCTLAVTCIFCFGQYTGVGNYNYAAPYSHEMLHGLGLSVLALACLVNWWERKSNWAVMAAGVCLGLVGLTKPDICVALVAAVTSAFILPSADNRASRLRSLAWMMGGLTIPLIAFFLLFLPSGRWQDALAWEFFGWRPMFISGVIDSPFYQWCLGLDDPLGHLRTIAVHSLILAVGVLACAWMTRRIYKMAHPTRYGAMGLLLMALIAGACFINWTEAGAALPVLCLVTLGLLWRRQNRGGSAPFFLIAWTVFALFLLAKQGLFPRLWQTGFALTMPAVICAIFLLGWELPNYLEAQFAVPAQPMRCLALAFLFIANASLVHTSLTYYQAKRLPVGSGPDVIFATGPGANAVEARTMNQALDWIKTNLPPAATLAAVPQGVLLNYLTRHPNSTPCLDWNPAMLAVFGVTNMNAALESSPPDYIALVEWEPYEFNEAAFGSKKYGADTLEWIRRHYAPVALFGSEPLRNGLFGIQILHRANASLIPAPDNSK